MITDHAFEDVFGFDEDECSEVPTEGIRNSWDDESSAKMYKPEGYLDVSLKS